MNKFFHVICFLVFFFVFLYSIRQAWGPHIDLGDPRLLALAAAEHQLIQSEYEEYAVASSGTLSCFRSVALIVS